jgi:hypothetical protein
MASIVAASWRAPARASASRCPCGQTLHHKMLWAGMKKNVFNIENMIQFKRLPIDSVKIRFTFCPTGGDLVFLARRTRIP